MASLIVSGLVLGVAWCLAAPAPITTASAPRQTSMAAGAMSELNITDTAEFERIVEAVDGWRRDDAQYKSITVAIANFSEAHPDFVPIALEAARLKWSRIANGFGIVHASKSMLPVYLDLQKRAPTYPKSYTMAARSYIYTSDFQGALPSLRKASELAPNDPWVDLTWSLFYSRQLNRTNAVSRALAAIPNAGDSPGAMANAVSLITLNNGVLDSSAADKLAQKIQQVQPNPEFLATVVSYTLDYGYQPGLWETAARLTHHAAAKNGPIRPLLLQWARIAMEGGSYYLDNNGLHPAFARTTYDILSELRKDPLVEESAWGLLVDLAIYNKNYADALSLIAIGNIEDYDPMTIALKKAALLTSQNKPREVVQLYEEENLPADDQLMMAKARTGGQDEARVYFLSQIADNPTSAYRLGNFAEFLLVFFKDSANSIYHAERAIEVMPYPLAKRTLASAYLTQSGELLARGSIDGALESFERAQKTGFDEKEILARCFDNCREILASLAAFR